MCNEQTMAELEAFQKQQKMSRRGFNAGATAAAATVAISPMAAMGASEVELNSDNVSVPTPDGDADCFWVRPKEGKHPAVIMWPDVHGVRPVFHQMAERLAAAGYAVLAVNPYYRTVKGRFIPAGKTIRDPGIRDLVAPHRSELTSDACVRDGQAMVQWLSQQPDVDVARGMGTIGYCMTSSFAMRIAGTNPDHIKAAASFHGGRLVTDGEDSPHLLIKNIRGGMLIAVAQNDHEREPAVLDVLKETFNGSKAEAEIEVYEGAMHGWCVPDNPAYSEPHAEKAWGRLLALLENYLS